MHRRWSSALPLLLMFVPALVSAQRAPNPDRAAVGEVITGLGEYFQAGDMSAAETLFRSGGMHILTDDATTHGWADYAALITLVTLAAYVWGLRSEDAARAVTMAFMTLALAQLFHLGNARSRGPVLTPRRAMANPWAVGAVALVLLLQAAAVYWAPLAGVLRTVPLPPSDWLIVLGLAAIPAVIGQIADSVQQHRAGRVPKPI